MKQLVGELNATQLAWQLVDSFNHLALLSTCADDLRTEAHLMLQGLEEQGWPENSADPARYPVAHERAEMLAGAIRATSLPTAKTLTQVGRAPADHGLDEAEPRIPPRVFVYEPSGL